MDFRSDAQAGNRGLHTLAMVDTFIAGVKVGKKKPKATMSFDLAGGIGPEAFGRSREGYPSLNRLGAGAR